VPSGNLGNITAGLFAREMGLPVARFIASNNANNVVFEYLETGNYQFRPSVETIANAMDVGAPSNFARILDLYHNSHKTISEIIKGKWYSDDKIREIVQQVYRETNYLCDPHGACGFEALKEILSENEIGVFLETAHPAKFTETMEDIIGKGNIMLPAKLAAFMKGEKKSILLGKNYDMFRNYLMDGIN
jgi:threonine synthase